MEFKYPKCITEPVRKLCEEIEKYHPGILEIKYNQDALNNWEEGTSILEQRMQMGLFFEFIRMGLSEKIHQEIEKECGIKL